MPTETTPAELRERIAAFGHFFHALQEEISRIIVGQTEIIENVLIALLVAGHVLLEGVPGLGKTLLVRTLARVLNVPHSRIQFTPDLMPADILGTTVLVDSPGGEKRFSFERGPLFSSIVLADEINRATPKTQSALLQAMQEGIITVGGVTYPLPELFLVVATQNPIEMEGTYPLPEAQLDRFLFKLVVAYPGLQELVSISQRTTGEPPVFQPQPIEMAQVQEMRQLVRQVWIAEAVMRYAARLILATQPGSPCAHEQTRRYVRYGASPRGMQALIWGAKARALLAGRMHVSCQDIRGLAIPALRHRIILNFEGEAQGISSQELIAALLQTTPEEE